MNFIERHKKCNCQIIEETGSKYWYRCETHGKDIHVDCSCPKRWKHENPEE